jgi:glycosyltransferase involved in cell wall biosynthesis
MRIAFISTILHYPLGGADTLWTRAAEAASTRGDRLFLSLSSLTAGHARIAALRDAGAIIHLRTPGPATLPFGQRVKRKLGLAPLSHQADLIFSLENFRPDLVVFSLGGTYDLLLYQQLTAWLRAGGVKFRIIINWQAEHPHLSAQDLDYTRTTFAEADALFFVSTRNLAVTRRHLLAALPNARVLQNPLRWQPADTSPWPVFTEVRLATVSRLDEGKGIHLILHALAETGSKLPPWRLEIFGLGPQEAELRATVAYLGLGERVVLRGHVGALRDIWRDNQLLCSPAIDDGVPMTIPEAMLCERPVFSTCVGGAEDWIENGRTGFLCPAATVPLITASLIEAFAARDRWAAIGQVARESALAHYRPDDYLSLIN